MATGPVSQELVFSASAFELKIRSAYAFDFLTTQATNIYEPLDSAKPAFGPGAFFGGVLDAPALTGKTRLTSYAVGDTVGLFSDRLLITVGARQQKIEVGINSDYSKTRTSPSVAAVFKVNKMLSVYGNYVEGLSQGETAPNTADIGMGNQPVNNAGAQLSPYVTKQKEVGAKFDAGRLGGSVALFSTDKPRAFVNTNLDYVASGKDQHRGAELNTYGVVISGFRVLGGVTWLDAVQKETGPVGLDDKHVIGVPRLLGNLGATWDMPWTDVSLDARIVYTGSSYADSANTLKVPAWTRVDLGARYGIELGENTLTLRARVDNVADRNYWGSVGGYPGAGYLVVGAPRTFALSASLDF